MWGAEQLIDQAVHARLDDGILSVIDAEFREQRRGRDASGIAVERHAQQPVAPFGIFGANGDALASRDQAEVIERDVGENPGRLQLEEPHARDGGLRFGQQPLDVAPRQEVHVIARRPVEADKAEIRVEHRLRQIMQQRRFAVAGMADQQALRFGPAAFFQCDKPFG